MSGKISASNLLKNIDFHVFEGISKNPHRYKTLAANEMDIHFLNT